MANKPGLPVKALLTRIKIEGYLENGKSNPEAEYFVHISVDGNKPQVKSTMSKFTSTTLLWDLGHLSEIWYAPSSKMKVEVYRKSRLGGVKKNLVGQYDAKVIELLENAITVNLMDKKGNPVPAQMKIDLAHPADWKDDSCVKLLMEKVVGNISHLPGDNMVVNVAPALWGALQLAKNLMDKLSTAHPILQASWTVLSHVYDAIQATNVMDTSIRDLAASLQEMLAGANAVPDLMVLSDSINVIEQISRQSLQVAALIDEYTKLSFAARTINMQISDSLKSRVENSKKTCSDLLSKFDRRVAVEVKNKVSIITNIQLAQEIRTWLSPPTISQNYNAAIEKWKNNTCSWFLEGEQFKQWIKNPGVLWVKGKAGCGKTILSASIIEKLQKSHLPFGIAYFFFDGRDSQTDLQTHDKLIRSLIAQFSKECGGIPTTLVDLYKHCRSDLDLQQPSCHQLEDTLKKILKQLVHVQIVIDALDECTEREKTLCWINKLMQQESQKIHLIVTSRALEDIQGGIGGHLCIDIGIASENHDIPAFVEHQIKSKLQQWDKETTENIKSQLVRGADGSFRWVSLQLSALENCLSPYEVQKQLDSLPVGLDKTYERILGTIDQKFIGEINILLQWLAFSKRPMTIAEIAETATVNLNGGGGPEYMASRRFQNPRGVLSRCSGLVTESQGSIKLSHFSLKEYLLALDDQKDFSINENKSHLIILQISLAYLLQFNSFEPLQDLHASPLAQYAAEHWLFHYRSSETSSSHELSLILKMFEPKGAALLNWIRIWNIDQPSESSQVAKTLQDITSPLYYASLMGLEFVVEQLIVNGDEVNADGGRFGGALQAAAFQGHELVVNLLLQNGADVNAQGGVFPNALYGAAKRGLQAIVKLLLENGANINASGGTRGNALQMAAAEGHENTVKLLLDNGAEVNTHGGYYGNALQAAAINGHEQVVNLLLQNGADVNAQGGAFSNALYGVAEGGQEAIVRLLLENKADVNASGGKYRNPLQIAAAEGHENIVKLLLDNGAAVNAHEGHYGNALQAAATGGHGQVVHLLLQSGADVNAQGGVFPNALYGAAECGQEAVVKLLIENGADILASEVYRGDALQGAAVKGHENIVELLLDNGAEVNAHGGHFGNALQAAAREGHKQVVNLLLQNGADVNVQGGEFFNALYGAAQGGQEEIVKLLLENGANVHASGEIYKDTLQMAAAEGHENIVKLLLDNGAEVNAQGGHFGNALQAAAILGHEQVINLLLQSGADVNAQGGEFFNALYGAVKLGQEAIVKMLLENGADMNASGGDYRNILQMAAVEGHENIVKLIIDNGGAVNAQGGCYGNALQAAAILGHEQIVNLLLQNGADVNAQGGAFSNALYGAAECGQEAIVKLLLENGGNANASGGSCGNPLQTAAAEGHQNIVKLLLGSGAEVNANGGYYGNALQAAAILGHEQVISLLLQNGADVNAQGGYYGNALQGAVIKGHGQIVDLLLQNGASVNAEGGEFSNALYGAAKGGQKEIVQLLLENGANVNASGGHCGNALQKAAAEGHENIVKLLLDNGAAVNAQGGQFGNALQAAAILGHEQVVNLLLQNGADVNAHGGECSNELYGAVKGGQEAIVQLLLKNGANVNGSEESCGNPLQSAAVQGDEY